MNAGFPLRALPSYTGTSKLNQKKNKRGHARLAYLGHYKIEKPNKKNQELMTEVMKRRSLTLSSLILQVTMEQTPL